MLRREVVAFAEGLLDTPYRHQGRLQSGSLDCIGLICAVGDHFGIDYEDISGYSRNPDPGLFREHLRRFTDTGRVWEIRDGSIGVFRQARFPAHLGIFGSRPDGSRTLIHALLPARRVIRQAFVAPFTDLLCEIREFPGIED